MDALPVNEPGAAPPEGRPVPLRVLRSAEAQALRWKKQAEALSQLLNQAIKDGQLGEAYTRQAKRIIARTV